MNILFVVPRVPEPPDTGGKIRTYNLLKQARAHGHNVILLPFSGRDRTLKKIVFSAFFQGLPISVAKYRSRKMAEAIVKAVGEKKIDLVHFDHVHMGQYIDFIPGVPAIIDEHNVECLILKRLADNTSNPLKKLALRMERQRMAALEVRVCSKASKVFFVSEEDRQNYGKLGGALSNTVVIPNGVDVEYFRTSDFGLRTSEESLVFTGSMDWVPNSDAVLYFCRELLPLIWQKNSGIRFYVVGKNPSDAIRKLSETDKRIIVTGGVPDVRPFVEKAKIFVVPLRIGGGTRLKILEALAMKKAVVSTTIGAEGIDVKNGEHIVLADTPESFAQKTLALLRDDKEREKLGEAGRRVVHDQYDWKIVGTRLNKVYLSYKNED